MNNPEIMSIGRTRLAQMVDEISTFLLLHVDATAVTEYLISRGFTVDELRKIGLDIEE